MMRVRVYSGLEDDHKQYGNAFDGAKWLLKPAPPDGLVAAIQGVTISEAM